MIKSAISALVALIVLLNSIDASADVTFLEWDQGLTHTGSVLIDNITGARDADQFHTNVLSAFSVDLMATFAGTFNISVQHHSSAVNRKITRSGSAASDGGGGGVGVTGVDNTQLLILVTNETTPYTFTGAFAGTQFTNISVRLYQDGGSDVFSATGNNIQFDGTGSFQGNLAPGLYRLELTTSIGVHGNHDPISGAAYDFSAVLDFGLANPTYSVASFNPDDVFVSTDPVDVTALDAAIGVSGYAIEDFEDEKLIPGLTYQNNLPENNVLASIQLVSDQPNTIWDGNQVGVANVNNVQIGDAIFRVAAGIDSFGVGISDVESNVKLLVNGTDLGFLRSLPNFKATGNTPMQPKQVYIRIDRQIGASPITEIRFEQIGSGFGDAIFFDHLAVFPNNIIPPTAVAGSDQSVRVGDTVVLDGSKSFDDNTASAALQYFWELRVLPAGSGATLMNGTTASPSFVADVDGIYEVDLHVLDEEGLSSVPDSVLISSINLAPTANAGDDLLVITWSPTTLDGSGSFDPDGDLLFYDWIVLSAPVGSIASIVNANGETASITTDINGVYEIGLTVSDFIGAGLPDSMQITSASPTSVAEIHILDSAEFIGALGGLQVTTSGNQNATLNFISQAVRQIQDGDIAGAIKKLEDAISRTDGCVLRGLPDDNGRGRDWITDCAAQFQVYGLLNDALSAIKP